ncbi:MAG: GAF domain-containing protein, partial [Pyrinomonadaceae bacterium]
MHVILLKDGHEYPAPALLDALREAGVGATVAPSLAHAPNGNGRVEVSASVPHAVIYEVADGADVVEVHAAIARAAANYPHAALVACRRALPAETHEEGRRLDAAALTRLGFRAVADDPAQVPALLRELESRGGNTGELQVPAEEHPDAAPACLLLPENVSVANLRAAFEAVSALHFVGDQRSAAQTALAGLAPLARADRWTLYLTETEADDSAARFEPLAARGLTASERELPEGDWRNALHTDALLSLMGSESHAAREARDTAETVRRTEGQRSVVAVPLVNGERVVGVVEAVREGTRARAFNDDEAALLDALREAGVGAT